MKFGKNRGFQESWGGTIGLDFGGCTRIRGPTLCTSTKGHRQLVNTLRETKDDPIVDTWKWQKQEVLSSLQREVCGQPRAPGYRVLELWTAKERSLTSPKSTVVRQQVFHFFYFVILIRNTNRSYFKRAQSF